MPTMIAVACGFTSFPVTATYKLLIKAIAVIVTTKSIVVMILTVVIQELQVRITKTSLITKNTILTKAI